MYEVRRFFDPPVSAGLDMGILGVGVLETMDAGCFVDRMGRDDCLCMFFHDEAQVGVKGCLKPARQQLMIWDANNHQVYGNGESTWTHSWIHVTGKYYPKRLKTLGVETGQLLGFPQLEVVLLRCLRALYEECCEADPMPEILRSHLDVFLLSLGRGCAAQTVIVPKCVRQARQLLDAQYHHLWTLNELSRTVGASVSHLSAEFTKHVGCPPMSYLRRLRLEQAALLLRNRGLRVGEVAQKVGYKDIFHFSKAFKQAYEVSPTAYMQKI